MIRNKGEVTGGTSFSTLVCKRSRNRQGGRWKRVPGSVNWSMWRISKDQESKVVSIWTTQDTYIAFPRDRFDKRWVMFSARLMSSLLYPWMTTTTLGLLRGHR